jgi:hypothetical protein
MSRIYANPFSWGEPVSGTHYVNRAKEQEQIDLAIDKQLQLVVTGARGSGKTSLVKQTLSNNSVASHYMDLTFVVTRQDLIQLLVHGIENSFPASKKESKTTAFLSSDYNGDLVPIINLWYDLVKASSQKFTLIWDSCHYLMKMKDDVLGEMREIMRDRRRITHIFISHREDILKDIFDDPGHPFFIHREMLFIKDIDILSFEKYLSTRFRRMGLSDFDLAKSLLVFTQGQPQLTQRLAHSLAQLWLEGTTSRLLDRAIDKLLGELYTRFASNWDEFGLNERRLLVGLSEGYSHPTELEFIRTFQLSATSTAHNTVLKLLRDGWIINRNEGYHIVDPLFLKWLKQHREIL